MLYRRWEESSRSRLAGVGFKAPGAAAFGNVVLVNDGGKGMGKVSGEYRGSVDWLRRMKSESPRLFYHWSVVGNKVG
jgi:hypothetical protein